MTVKELHEQLLAVKELHEQLLAVKELHEQLLAVKGLHEQLLAVKELQVNLHVHPPPDSTSCRDKFLRDGTLASAHQSENGAEGELSAPQEVIGREEIAIVDRDAQHVLGRVLHAELHRSVPLWVERVRYHLSTTKPFNLSSTLQVMLGNADKKFLNH